MRIKEDFKKAGFFWRPSAPDRKIPGQLTIKDGGDIELEVVGAFDDTANEYKRYNSGNAELGRIVGHIEKYGLVTLEDCFYTNYNLPLGGISKSTICVNKALIGAAYEDNEAVLFNTFTFSVDGIDEWVGLSGIKVQNEFDKRTATITYSPQEDIQLNLKNGMRLLIIFTWTLPSCPTTTEASIKQKTYFKFVTEKEQPLTDFISAAYKVTTLLGFAIDKTVCIEHVTSTSNTILRKYHDGTTAPVKISVYYASLPFTKSRPKIDSHRMLFCFGQIRNDAERIVNNWFDAYEAIDPALNLYFSTKTGAYEFLDSKFLALAQGLETYHRRTSQEKLMDDAVFKEVTEQLLSQCPIERREWLAGRLSHGNEMNLGRRIKSIIEPYKELVGDEKDQKKIIRSVVDTRNYLTHFDKSLESRVVSGRSLLVLCHKMEAIFQLHLLQVLGFTTAEIKAVINSSHKLRQKFKEDKHDDEPDASRVLEECALPSNVQPK